MTASELIQSLPQRMKPGSGAGVDIVFHFKIAGTNGGDFTVKVKDGTCTVENGLSGEPKCVVEAKDNVYEDVEMGRTNAQMAVLFGKVKVSNIPSMLKFVEMFERAT
ncbi:MAG TPA: SCP2 sterol-binding domain-containing protein [Chitinophagales bacterium]|nr:SCP2 sterol-binding domain-containing protein [Chitinophagales bacterium]